MNKAALVGGIFLVLLAFNAGLGGSTYGGVYQTDVKFDFVAGNTTDTRVSGGQQPVGVNFTGSLACWRLGIFGVRGCEGVAPPTNATASSGCGEDWRPKQNRVGLRRLVWVQAGLNKFNALPQDDG